MTAEIVLFWLLSVMTVASAVTVVLARSAINSAMSLVATFFFLAGLYVLLWAHTIAVLQVLVYAGAIMVLFLFVIMLLSLTDTGPGARVTLPRVVGGLAAVGIFVALAAAIRALPAQVTLTNPARALAFGTLKQLGGVLYTQYLLPFEVVSLLLLVAIVGAVVVAKSRI